jgi:hypothetical protein
MNAFEVRRRVNAWDTKNTGIQQMQHHRKTAHDPPPGFDSDLALLDQCVTIHGAHNRDKCVQRDKAARQEVHHSTE